MDVFRTYGAVIALLIASFATTLLGLSYVNSVIFDEVHFGKFVTAYCCTQSRFFDIHPPHAKLLIAGASYLAGYRGELAFENIGQEYTSSVARVRLFPAIAGALLPLVIYAILRTIGVSKLFSFLGGLAVVFDNAVKVQSRVIGLDSFLLLATFASIWFFLVWLSSARGSRSAWALVGSGIAAGLAAGTKFTGLAALGIVGLALLILLVRELWEAKNEWKKRAMQYVVAGLTVLAVAIAVYGIGWVIHVKLLSQPGGGDAWGARTGNIVQDIVQEHKAMLDANYNLTATHPYSSKWWSWPAMARPVFYWSGGERWVYFIGNPVVWWGSAVLLVVAATTYILSPQVRKKTPLIALIFLGYIVSYMPFMRIPRALFLYHYLTPLLFGVLAAFWWADAYIPQKYKKNAVISIAALLAVGFIAFSPLTYGFDGWQEDLMWFSGWR